MANPLVLRPWQLDQIRAEDPTAASILDEWIADGRALLDTSVPASLHR